MVDFFLNIVLESFEIYFKIHLKISSIKKYREFDFERILENFSKYTGLYGQLVHDTFSSCFQRSLL